MYYNYIHRRYYLIHSTGEDDMTYQDVLTHLQLWQATIDDAEFGSDAYHDAKERYDQILGVLTWREWNFLRDHAKKDVTPEATAKIIAAVVNDEDPTPILNLALNHRLSWNFLHYRRKQQLTLTEVTHIIPDFSEGDLRKIEAGSIDLKSADWAQLFQALTVSVHLKFS